MTKKYGQAQAPKTNRPARPEAPPVAPPPSRGSIGANVNLTPVRRAANELARQLAAAGSAALDKLARRIPISDPAPPQPDTGFLFQCTADVATFPWLNLGVAPPPSVVYAPPRREPAIGVVTVTVDPDGAVVRVDINGKTVGYELRTDGDSATPTDEWIIGYAELFQADNPTPAVIGIPPFQPITARRRDTP